MICFQNASGRNTLQAKRTLSFSYTNSVSVETTKSITAGLSVTVQASASVGVATVGTSVTSSLSAGFSTTSGTVETTEVTDSIEAGVDVPPGKTYEIKIVGHSMQIDVPYEATLVTTYNDGSTKEERTTGIFVGVETNQFRVQKNEI